MLPAVTRAQSAQQAAASTAQISLPAPNGGLNTRDNLGAMRANDARTLINMIPDTAGVISRKGYKDHLSALTGNVDTIAEYRSGTVNKMIIGAGSKLYAATLSVNSQVEIGSGYNSSRWQTAMHNSRLLLCNGVDSPQEYDGTSVSAISLSGSGLTPSNLKAVMVHINRAFYMEKAAPHFWYADTAGGYSGTLVRFDLSQYSQRGGNLAMMASWSRDGGAGPDDYAVFFMTSGEVVVFAGTDPGDTAAWSVVGRYYIGAPIDSRGVVPVGGDLYVLNKADFLPMSQVLKLGRATEGVTKLAGAAADAARLYGNGTGWQVTLYPRGNLLFFNVPLSASQFRQFGINTLTGGAFEFRGWNARCFGVVFDRLFMGVGNTVKLADEGLQDGSSAIEIDVEQAFSDFGRPDKKQVNMFSPVLDVDSSVSLTLSIAYDFSSAETSQTVSSDSPGTPYDTETYDTEFYTPENVLTKNWYSSVGRGRSVSIRIKASLLNKQLTWYRTDFIYTRMTGN